MAKSPDLYVDKAKFFEAMKNFHAECVKAKANNQPRPQASNYIGQCITYIATNLARSPKYSGYSYKDEMISDAIENAIAYIHCFDPNKSTNPFAYFTRATLCAFWRRIGLEKGIQYKKYIAMQLALLNNDSVGGTGQKNEKIMIDFGVQDHINDYEKKAKEKKDKKNGRAKKQQAAQNPRSGSERVGNPSNYQEFDGKHVDGPPSAN